MAPQTKKSKKSREKFLATSPEADDYLEIAEKVRTGEYFREARGMYDLGVHDPMAERYMYIFITFLALVILIVTLKAMQDFYPLNTEIPIITAAEDNGENVTHIHTLLTNKADNPGEALLRFLITNYITAREEYDITTFDRDAGTVKSQSAEEVTKEYQELIDPRNPESPITLYQRHSKRKITVLATQRSDDSMEVIFEAEVDGKNDVKKSHWRANISFQYSGLALDQDGKFNPMSFVVTKYHSKRLQDIQ